MSQKRTFTHGIIHDSRVIMLFKHFNFSKEYKITALENNAVYIILTNKEFLTNISLIYIRITPTCLITAQCAFIY